MQTAPIILPISALQHYLYCPRQCALIHIERVWADNQFTAEGELIHERAHEAPDESRPGVRITRGMPIRSTALGLAGQCDVVEFHEDGRIVLVEYKRGRPKQHRADEVQICAQAICLEEMLAVSIAGGFLFYGKRKRRTPVAFDQALRNLTRLTTERVRALFTADATPMAEYERRKCSACSLEAICLPKSNRFQRGAAAWFSNQLAAAADPLCSD